MKTIKFRAFDLNTKEMKQVEFIYLYEKEDEDGNLGEVSFVGEKITKYFGNGSLKQVELMQFTGFKDKNGKEIFEGDIVKFKFGRGFAQSNIIFNSGSFYVENYHRLSYWEIQKSEIIGNKYENPELLNK